MSEATGPASPTILSLLAQDPSAPAQVLSALTGVALASGATSSISPLSRALVAHPAIPIGDLAELVSVAEPSLLAEAIRRPGLTLSDVDALVGRSRNDVVLAAALAATSDEQGSVHASWVRRSTSPAVLAAAMTHSSAADVRHVAADKLVARKHLSNEDRKVVLAYRRRHPERAERLAQLCGDKVYRKHLMPAAEPDPGGGELVRGSRGWLYSPTTAVEEVLEVARAGGPVAVFAWQVAVGESASPSTAVLQEALDAAGGDPKVLTSVLGSPAASAAQQVRACEALLSLRDLRRDTATRELLARVARTGDPAVVAAFIRWAAAPKDADVVRGRADLSEESVVTLFELVHRGFETGAIAQRTLSQQRVAWGAWFATHPAAPPALRATGLDWATDFEHEATVRPYNAAQRPDARAMWSAAGDAAQAGVDHGSDLVGLGRALPYAAVSAVGLRDGAGIVAAVRAAVRSELGRPGWDVDAQLRVTTLATLSVGFVGSVGELLDTAAAVSS